MMTEYKMSQFCNLFDFSKNSSSTGKKQKKKRMKTIQHGRQQLFADVSSLNTLH